MTTIISITIIIISDDDDDDMNNNVMTGAAVSSCWGHKNENVTRLNNEYENMIHDSDRDNDKTKRRWRTHGALTYAR